MRRTTLTLIVLLSCPTLSFGGEDWPEIDESHDYWYVTECPSYRPHAIWVRYATEPNYVGIPPWLDDWRNAYGDMCIFDGIFADVGTTPWVTTNTGHPAYICEMGMGCFAELSCCINPSDLAFGIGCSVDQPHYFERKTMCESIPGYVWDDLLCDCLPDVPHSPILVSSRGNQCELTNIAFGVNFDLDSDGEAERIGWTALAAEAAFLSLDRNENGTIDDGTELFGDVTPQPDVDEKNGFLALAVYDEPENGGDGDGEISESDAIFESLRLWTDVNHDGISQPEELATLASRGVVAISLEYRESRRTDRYGNEFRFLSHVVVDPAQPGPARLKAVDVFLINTQ